MYSTVLYIYIFFFSTTPDKIDENKWLVTKFVLFFLTRFPPSIDTAVCKYDTRRFSSGYTGYGIIVDWDRTFRSIFDRNRLSKCSLTIMGAYGQHVCDRNAGEKLCVPAGGTVKRRKRKKILSERLNENLKEAPGGQPPRVLFQYRTGARLLQRAVTTQ